MSLGLAEEPETLAHLRFSRKNLKNLELAHDSLDCDKAFTGKSLELTVSGGTKLKLI